MRLSRRSKTRPYTFKLADFPFADPNDQPANALRDVNRIDAAGRRTRSRSPDRR